MFAKLHGIWIERTDGMPCEWDGPCTRRSSYNLDDAVKDEVCNLNLCTQHTKMVMRRVTGRQVMAEDLERVVERERACAAIAVKAFSAGWDAARESMASEETIC